MKQVNDFFSKQVLFVISSKEHILERELVLFNKLLSVAYQEKKKRERERGGLGGFFEMTSVQNFRILKFCHNHVFICLCLNITSSISSSRGLICFHYKFISLWKHYSPFSVLF